MHTPKPVFERFVEGIWLASSPVSIVGMPLSATMAVVRREDGGLLLFSPVALTQARADAVSALGEVTDLYAPNTFHHQWIGDWAKAFPNATVHAPAALEKKRPDLNVGRRHDVDPLNELSATFDEVHIDGFMLDETVLVHRPSATLLVADLVHNIGRPTGWWTVTYTKIMGFYDQVALSHMIRWTAFHDRRAARKSVDRLFQLRFERLVVGHGNPIDGGAKQAVVSAYDWLEARKPILHLPGSIQPPRKGRCG